MESPTRYVTELREAAGDYTAAGVRRHFVDNTRVKGKKPTWVATKDRGLVAQIIECDVLELYGRSRGSWRLGCQRHDLARTRPLFTWRSLGGAELGTL